MKLIALTLVALLCSCTVNQVYMERPDGSVRFAYNGGSSGTKSLNDTATMKFKDVVMERTVTGKDEVEGAATLARLGLLKMAVGKGIDAAQETTSDAIKAVDQ